MSEFIYHITTETAAEAASSAGTYSHSSLESEGFIHCSTVEQLLIPANERYRGQSDLVILVIDVSALTELVVYEDSYGSGIEFPHLYGPLPWRAVVRVVAFPCGPDGDFSLPGALRSTPLSPE